MAIIFVTKGKTNWKYLAIVFILGVIVGAGSLWLSQKQTIPIIQLPEIKKPEKVVKDETAELVPSEVEGWKTYRNDKSGYKIKYPSEFSISTASEPDWDLLAISRIGFEGFPGNFNINVMYKGTYQDKEIQEWDNQISQIPELDPNLVLIDEVKGIKSQLGLPLKGIKILLVKNNKLYEISYRLPQEPSDILNEEIFNQMISSFKFLDWQLFSIEEYGFSLKIHPDYKKTREEEIEREGLKIKIIVFSKDSEKIGITIDREPDTIKIMRSVLFDVFKLGPEEWRKSLEYYGLVELGTEFISKENIETGTCMGIQLLEKKEQKYERNLILTSRNLENMYVTILFEYYTKDTEAEVLKTIETIECTK